MKNRIARIVFLAGALYYLIGEAISAVFFNDSLLNTYVFHTISELGIPGANSPLAMLMNSAFIIIGLTFLFCNFYRFKDFIVKNRVIFYVLTVTASLGVIIVALIHAGNPVTDGYHSLGAVMAILGGNVLLAIISKSMSEFGIYQKITLVLGVIGLIAFWLMFFNMENIYMPVLERLSVYTLIMWCLLNAFYLKSE